MKVWRIADKNRPKMGFYRILNEQFGFGDLYYSFATNSHHPCPNTSSIEPKLCKLYSNKFASGRMKDYYFGFHRKYLMDQWINGCSDHAHIDKLCNNQHFYIYEYDAVGVKEFNKQCIFVLDKSTVINKYHFREYFG